LGDPALQLYISPKGIPVEAEWNLISLPRQPEDASVETVLSSLNNGWKKLLAYSNGTWIGADSDIPSSFWTLKQMEWGRGYWLQTIDQGQIVVAGTEKSSSLPLNIGWNLIGNTTPLNQIIPDALTSINGKWKKLLYYSAGTWYGADASVPTSFWSLNELKPGAGYWLEMAEEDTLEISRIPSSQNDLMLSNSKNRNSFISNLRSKSNLSLHPTQGIKKTNFEKHYKLSVPRPSGYYGTVTLKNVPAPYGSKISAWINGIHIPPEITISTPGQYDLMLLNGDDPQTPEIEGGIQGDQIIFKIQTLNEEVFISDKKDIWEEGINHRLDISALSINDSSQIPISIEIKVNDRIVGQDILDGDPISNNATIFAIISGGDSQLTSENFQLYLNSQLLDKNLYSYIPNTENSEFRAKLVYLPSSLTDGEYDLRIEVIENGAASNKNTVNFSFLISTTLKLEKVVNFPNPMQQDTKFTYYLLNDNPADVSIKIYTVAGRLIKTIQTFSNQVGYNEIYWNGTDEFGDEIANGVYFYKITAKNGSEKTELIERLVVMK